MAKSRQRRGLSAYRDKRSAGSTPEPFGGAALRSKGEGGRFVVQKHGARRLHYDFRLELDGVLVSWAVPRGPSLDPKEKRLAVQTEDHPLEYADFEGVIPEGNYGAGAVIVWDRGRWQPVEDPASGLAGGDLKFRLFGHKLRGEWVLVRSSRKDSENEWLLIKKADEFAGTEIEPAEESVLSGLTLEEMRDGPKRAAESRERLEALGAPEADVRVEEVALAQCETYPEPFSGDDWIFELKYDGYRMLASVRDGKVALRYRSGYDATRLYPEIELALLSLPFDSLILDGEVVVFDDSGRTDFGRLQQRAMLSRQRDVIEAMSQHPATLIVFDLIAFEGYDVRPLPLSERKELLAGVVARTGVVRFADHIEARGEEFFERLAELDLEGMVGKRIDRPYPRGRSGDWRRVRLSQSDDFAIVGYTQPRTRNRAGFGGLHLAVRDSGEWSYAGKVGSGFSDALLDELGAKLEALDDADYPEFEEQVAGGGSRWIVPELCCEVRYKEWRPGRLLRQPTFVRLRDDKRPMECLKRNPDREPEPPPEPEEEAAVSPEEVVVRNADKLFWPEDGYTKGDLVDYYRSVAPWLLPYLRDRPLVLTRYPDGIDGKSFYQKDAPTWVPDWIRTESVWSEHSEREIHYFICESEAALVYLANLGTIPLHVWGSRASDLARPDWCILDLDPKGAPFANVVGCARAIHALCEEIGLPTYVKTSGSTGLHVLIPLGGQCTYEQCRTLAGLIARVIEEENGELATTERVIQRREGKVYLDWLQNRHGQLLVAPYSVRPLAGATVSMPLRWREVTEKLDYRRFTIKTALARLRRMKDDPLLAVLTERPDLLAALERLGERVQE